MKLSSTITKAEKQQKAKQKRPKLMLVGSFTDLFLEAITELGFEFELNKSSKPTKSAKYDVIVVDGDRSAEALDYVKKYKAVPVMYQANKYFNDFNPVKESGNAFIYTVNNDWNILEAVLRANETFKFKYDWKTLMGEVSDTAKYSVKNLI
jgi:hypothetical protein